MTIYLINPKFPVTLLGWEHSAQMVGKRYASPPVGLLRTLGQSTDRTASETWALVLGATERPLHPPSRRGWGDAPRGASADVARGVGGYPPKPWRRRAEEGSPGLPGGLHVGV